MRFLGIVVAAMATTMAFAFEEGESACPALAEGETAFPTCEECLSNNCGYAIDEGDCVADCSTVTDTECFSLATSSGEDAAAICELAAAATRATNTTGGDEAVAETEEEFCAVATSTCEECIAAGCGFTADDGDCLSSCDQVNDGAECISDAASCSTSGEDDAVAETEEEFCAVATSTCEECIAAGCGFTADDGDCLSSCDQVNDGAECVSDAASCSSTGDSFSSSSYKARVVGLLLAVVANLLVIAA
ncbi:hypothetical protein ACHAXN_002586 [Cyclotella atomus]